MMPMWTLIFPFRIAQIYPFQMYRLLDILRPPQTLERNPQIHTFSSETRQLIAIGLLLLNLILPGTRSIEILYFSPNRWIPATQQQQQKNRIQ